jgi:uncharacterized protein YdaU (DUF1376 family)
MKGDVDAWMPLWLGDYFKATRHLDATQHGAYLLLIFECWTQSKLPDDDAALARIACLAVRNWRKIRPVIEPFFVVGGGSWTHKRVDAEKERAKTRKAQFSEKASRAANARWNAPSNASSIATSNGHALLEDCPPSPPSPDANASKTPNGVSSERDDIQEVVDAWNTIADRRGLSKVVKLTAKRRQQVKARLRENTVEEIGTALAAIERSPFLCGNSKDGWRANFDFFLQPSSFTKLLEGAYDH